MKTLLRLIYKLGLASPYQKVDRFRYLKRLRKGKRPGDDLYFYDCDLDQFGDKEILVLSRFHGASVFFSCLSPYSYVERKILKEGIYQAGLMELISSIMPPDCAFVDVGANIGTFSIPIAKAFPEIEVYAFEPNPAAIERFERNASLNGPPMNLHLHGVGVGSSRGTLHLRAFDGKDMGLSSFIVSAKTTSAEPIPVEVVTLGETFSNCRQRVGFIKIDVEGFELEVLAGGQTIIAEHRPFVLFEHSDEHFPDLDAAHKTKQGLRDFFDRNGYRVFYVTRRDEAMLFPVVWDRPLSGDLLAMPFGRKLAIAPLTA